MPIKVARHRYATHYGNQIQIYMGPNPYGPKGGRCGNVVDARMVYYASWKAAWVDKAYAALRAYCAVRNILGLPEPPQEHLDDIEKVAKRRRTSREDCILHVLHTYVAIEDLPLLINDVPEAKYLLESAI